MRAAGIDVGSNGIRLLVAEVGPADALRPIHKQRAAVRLGHGTFVHQALDEEGMQDAVEAVAGFAVLVQAGRVDAARAVATSAVREATNQADWLARVVAAGGPAIDVIDGQEEARLVHRAIRARLTWADKPWAVADLGGGSLEIALVERESIIWSESRPIGTVRLVEAHAEDSADAARLVHDEVDAFTLLHDMPPIAGLAFTGGNINEVARLTGHRPRGDPPPAVPVSIMHAWLSRLEGLTQAQRIHRFGLRPDRADVIVPALMVFERVASLCGVDSIYVPGWGLREGVVLDLADKHLARDGHP